MPEQLLHHQQPEPAEVLHVPDRLPEVLVLAEGASSPSGGRAGGRAGKGAPAPGRSQVHEGWAFPQPNGYTCSDYTQCRSGCCITNSHKPVRFCTPRTIFLQCLPWRKVRARGCGEVGRG